jgi:hypothetical protein
MGFLAATLNKRIKNKNHMLIAQGHRPTLKKIIVCIVTLLLKIMTYSHSAKITHQNRLVPGNNLWHNLYYFERPCCMNINELVGE